MSFLSLINYDKSVQVGFEALQNILTPQNINKI